jgi:DNA polymerase I
MFARFHNFKQVWLVDFEFYAPPGDRQEPICLVAWEILNGQKLRVAGKELTEMKWPPYDVSSDSLLVAYYASAEIGCHLALGWNIPANVLDLYVEFRNITNGRDLPCGNGLLGALTSYGLSGIEVSEKKEMRELALRGGPYSSSELSSLLDYCESDVIALVKLLGKMAPALDIPHALLRGRYMVAAAKMESIGVPIDVSYLATLRDNWTAIQAGLIDRIDEDYHVFEARTFKRDRWARYLAENRIPWPVLPSGALALDDDTFREMARAYPSIAPIRELRVSLSQMRLSDLAVGRDGRNRLLLSAFASRTGRNQPSNSEFIYGPAVWLRGLIKPEPGQGLAYIDWSQQEFGIAAALSRDPAMMFAYETGDPYLTFAKQSGAIPPEGTKASHGPIREQFKQCALALQYGMGDVSLAQRIGQPTVIGRDLIRLHRQTYPIFWEWSDSVVDYAMLYGRLHTVFGWTIHVGAEANPRSLRNFPMQANGAEMLRLACCFATEQAIEVCAPIHDAILIQAPLERLAQDVETAQEAMVRASEIVLGGFRLRSEVKLVRFPDRYQDERGKRMWETVEQILGSLR